MYLSGRPKLGSQLAGSLLMRVHIYIHKPTVAILAQVCVSVDLIHHQRTSGRMDPNTDEHVPTESDGVQALRKDMDAIYEKFPAGPSAYIKSVLNSEKHQQDFLQYLWESFQESEECVYQWSGDLPYIKFEQQAEGQPLCLHVGTLAYADGSSLKPPVGVKVWKKLMDQFMGDGFVTSSEPLLIRGRSDNAANQALDKLMGHGLTAPWKANGDMEPHSIAYVKGQARALSIIAFLVWGFGKRCSRFKLRNQKEILASHS